MSPARRGVVLLLALATSTLPIHCRDSDDYDDVLNYGRARVQELCEELWPGDAAGYESCFATTMEKFREKFATQPPDSRSVSIKTSGELDSSQDPDYDPMSLQLEFMGEEHMIPMGVGQTPREAILAYCENPPRCNFTDSLIESVEWIMERGEGPYEYKATAKDSQMAAEAALAREMRHEERVRSYGPQGVELLRSLFPTMADRILSLNYIVVVPFHPKSVNCAIALMLKWQHHLPCDPAAGRGVGHYRPDLAFYYLPSLDDYPHNQLGDILMEALQLLPEVRSCFGQVKMLSAELSPFDMEYKKTDTQRVYRGPNNLFFKLFDNPEINTSYDYMFLMDTDIAPVKPHWLSRLNEEILLTASDFWQKGAVSKEDGYYEPYFAAQGVYRLGDPRFNDFLRAVRTDAYLDGHDIAIWRRRSQSSELNWAYQQQINAHFHPFDFCNDENIYWKDPSKYPDTYVVHYSRGNTRRCDSDLGNILLQDVPEFLVEAKEVFDMVDES